MKCELCVCLFFFLSFLTLSHALSSDYSQWGFVPPISLHHAVSVTWGFICQQSTAVRVSVIMLSLYGWDLSRSYHLIFCVSHNFLGFSIMFRFFFLPLHAASQSSRPGRKPWQLWHIDARQSHRPHSPPALWRSPLLHDTCPFLVWRDEELHPMHGQPVLTLLSDLFISYLD